MSHLEENIRKQIEIPYHLTVLLTMPFNKLPCLWQSHMYKKKKKEVTWKAVIGICKDRNWVSNVSKESKTSKLSFSLSTITNVQMLFSQNKFYWWIIKMKCIQIKKY